MCIIAILFGGLKIYYVIGNYKYDNKIKELIDNRKMDFQIESKIDHKTIENNESAKHFTRKSFTVMSGLDRLIANRSIQMNYPLLILSGEKDNELALKMAKQWHEEEQMSKLFIIENAGHCANMDNAEEFNNVVMNFITTKQ